MGDWIIYWLIILLEMKAFGLFLNLSVWLILGTGKSLDPVMANDVRLKRRIAAYSFLSINDHLLIQITSQYTDYV